MYGTTVNELKSLNNISSNILQIGQVLKIPNTNQKTYTVKKGDSLWKIAKENNTTISALINLNNLKTTTLQIGQLLKLPN